METQQKEYISTKREHEAIIQDHTVCCLCGSKLKFKHQVDFLTMQVKEEGHCPSCMIPLKASEHILQ